MWSQYPWIIPDARQKIVIARLPDILMMGQQASRMTSLDITPSDTFLLDGCDNAAL